MTRTLLLSPLTLSPAAQVVVQITQNLSSRIRNAHAFELPSIYIPDHTRGEAPRIHNALEKTCEEM